VLHERHAVPGEQPFDRVLARFMLQKVQNHRMIDHLLRKDARIAGIPTYTAMRATTADESAALLYGVVSVALTGLRRLPAQSMLAE
jgi:hypothetical protein